MASDIPKPSQANIVGIVGMVIFKHDHQGRVDMISVTKLIEGVQQ
jgi:hypothetical protein